MTTIDEMDEYLNFEDASHHPFNNQFNVDLNNLGSGPVLYDINNLAFANPEADENSFTCLQHFSVPEEQLSQEMQNALFDTSALSATDIMDFPRWIDGMTDNQFNPCTRCRTERTHCKVINEGFRKGSCTSCVALARSCSLTYDPNMKSKKSYDYRSSGKINCAIDNEGNHFVDEEKTSPSEQCGYCKTSGQLCRVDGEKGVDACVNCTHLNRPCSLVLYHPTPTNDRTPSSPTFNPYSGSRNNSSSDLLSLNTSTDIVRQEAITDDGGKAGARFSRQSVRILKDWLGLHHHHPYPTDQERGVLMAKTGLNKKQITNWLANARRRGKSRPTVTPPTVGNYANAMDIPRRGTPALETMNPLERWKHSPPEHEPASASAIAKAVTSSTFSSGLDSPYTSYDDGSNRSLYNASSASSLGTSQSSAGSFNSAYSHRSRGSFGSFGSFGNKGGKRRRRRQAPKPVKAMTSGPPRMFQCTFCTESFKTKHDWQRHEKSLHLSLERWICCPEGPSMFCKEYNRPTCVYCGHPNPPHGHAETHNHSSCAEKPIEERTFYRKDHLRQHLHLVHDVKFLSWSMESWQAVTPEIRSRCGFCGIIMDSWSARVDHLAEHFKSGLSMAEWKGDWGFEPQILNIVENGIPPYLIHDERISMKPFEASQLFEADHNFENLVKSGLIQYVNDKIVAGVNPTDEELLALARQIIRNMDNAVDSPNDIEASWLRDLILFSGNQDITLEQQRATGVQHADDYDIHALQTSKIVKTSRHCAKERALREYVTSRQMLGLTATDSELQAEACRIIDEAEKTAAVPSKGAASWFKYLIKNSTSWLYDFRRRAGLPRSSEMKDEGVRPTDDKTIDHAIHNYARLEAEMKDYVRLQATLGISPSDPELQLHARMIIYGNDDPWNQTWADDPAYLHLFKSQNGLAPAEENGDNLTLPTVIETTEQAPSPPSSKTLHWDFDNTRSLGTCPGLKDKSPTYAYNQPLNALVSNQPSTNSNPTLPLKYFLNDANCYNRLLRELTRYVARTMSPNNPSRHAPTDAEIQNQARWVIYEDDDPWNQTAADNAEWLMRFKRDVGLIPSDFGPGLPTGGISWKLGSGGSGFSPPYVNPGKDFRPPAGDGKSDLAINVARVDENEKIIKVRRDTAMGYIRDLKMKERYEPPAQVFCSRELENGLRDFVQEERGKGTVPSDEMLREKAREILKTGITAADDVALLEKFKFWCGISSEGPMQRGKEQTQTHNREENFSNSLQLQAPQPYQPQAQSLISAGFAVTHDRNRNQVQGPAFLNNDELLANFEQDLGLDLLGSQMEMEMPFEMDINTSPLSANQNQSQGRFEGFDFSQFTHVNSNSMSNPNSQSPSTSLIADGLNAQTRGERTGGATGLNGGSTGMNDLGFTSPSSGFEMRLDEGITHTGMSELPETQSQMPAQTQTLKANANPSMDFNVDLEEMVLGLNAGADEAQMGFGSGNGTAMELGGEFNGGFDGMDMDLDLGMRDMRGWEMHSDFGVDVGSGWGVEEKNEEVGGVARDEAKDGVKGGEVEKGERGEEEEEEVIDEEEMNKDLEYAVLHRVNTATASPWRRRATLKGMGLSGNSSLGQGKGGRRGS